MEDRGEGEEEEEEQQAALGPSIETQIGRKLREIGDKFQHDHIDTVRTTSRHQAVATTTAKWRYSRGSSPNLLTQAAAALLLLAVM